MAVNNFDHILAWSQFQQLIKRPAGQKEDAQIHPEMSFSHFKLNKKKNAVVIEDVDIEISLVSTDCWVVANQMTNELLKHEQGHYDILALSARAIYKELLALSASNAQELQKKANTLKEKSQQKVKLVDARYDKQTSNSQNKAIQDKWNKAIAKEKQKPDGSIDNLP